MIKATPTGADLALAKRVSATPSLPNCIAWYKYNEGIAVTGSGVSRWADASGNGNHLLQGTDANRPALQSDGSILFDGVAQYLKANAFTLNQPETIYLLAKQITWTLSDTIFDGDAVNSGRLYETGTTPNITMYAGLSGPASTSLILDTYSVISCVFNGASSILQINNGTPATGNPSTANMGGFTLGVRGDIIANWANIQVMETIIFNVAHDASTRNQMIGYLARLGGLSI